MDKNIKCDLTFCDQYCLCYIELYKAQHPPVQMDKNIKCDLNSVISTVYATSNCMRRNTRQFRWIKILSAILHFVISTVHVTSNCIRRNSYDEPDEEDFMINNDNILLQGLCIWSPQTARQKSAVKLAMQLD